MIFCPAWIVEETPAGYLARLGSEPRKDSHPDLVPRDSVSSCVYSSADGTDEDGSRFAILVLSRVPDFLTEKFPGVFQRPLT